MSTKIEWTDETWNPVTGCTKVSQGCKNCYAERLWPKVEGSRLKREATEYDSPRPFTDVRCHPERLEAPMVWKKPRRVFVNSMSDLFHEAVPDDFLDETFAVMALCPQHTFQILTKRPQRMLEYIDGLSKADHGPGVSGRDRVTRAVNAALFRARKDWGKCGSSTTAITTLSRGSGAREPDMLRKLEDGRVQRLHSIKNGAEVWSDCGEGFAARVRDRIPVDDDFGWALKEWPISNVWLGVSTENQKTFDERVELLAATPAAVRFVSAEPLLEQIDVGNAFDDPPDGSPYGRIDWVIAGGESGPKARPSHPAWFRSLRDDCAGAGVPFFFKQWGAYVPFDAMPDTVLKQPIDGIEVDGVSMARVGKRAAGRVLDGRTHEEYPA